MMRVSPTHAPPPHTSNAYTCGLTTGIYNKKGECNSAAARNLSHTLLRSSLAWNPFLLWDKYGPFHCEIELGMMC